MLEDFEDIVSFGINSLLHEVAHSNPPKVVFNVDGLFDSLYDEIMKEEERKHREYVRNKPDGFQTANGKRKCIDKVIIEKRHCIIIDNFGNKYIAKPEKGERYDKEKGFLVALAKYNGYSTSRVHYLLENAVDKDDKKSKKSKKPIKKN